MKNFLNILVGVDFSSCSTAALRQAGRLAEVNGSRIHIVHVIDSLVMEDLAMAARNHKEELSVDVASEMREKVKKALPDYGLPETTNIDIRIGVPLALILAKVKEISADLLVLGVHGASGQDANAGALATACVRQSPVPVLLIREEHTQPFKVVVACVDFSDHSANVVEEAIRIAKQENSKLRLLHVYYPPWYQIYYDVPIPQISPDYMQEYLVALQSHLHHDLDIFKSETGGMDIDCDIRESPGHAEGIVNYLKEINANLAVLGTRGRTKLGYLLLGSTAEKVIRNTPCSVLAIKPLKLAKTQPSWTGARKNPIAVTV